mmetsp:Transcript_14562/g.26389  ORF Transcript_14562/g.26389 Transcript_14562/m.26389 type:complete len:678 (+) Transcript_14562:191-2224(+)|eukprot:CAMPEP_0201870194 /NCGR_PEP_ID=MMETSP0902-20130614/3387_1 /ASSEMBLY_ACC=CAM_ASM_000551 /TAXON_ID=420261 /ORGANISM="Thalassiosira antarctica, Strain CCMP982" /LENGTH=677 /DNA_ID=CAMNT_0048395771 /DNA_START=95 /DNA_END=2128 /DNA_ORIENTATION=+
MPKPNSKKRVNISAPANAPPRRTRSMGPKQQSLATFTPDNYSDDEDDKFFHEDAQNGKASSEDASSSSQPGAGWSNGQVPPQFTPTMTLHPYTRSGRLALYNHHRRWINFQSSWSRIGAGSTEMDAVHSKSSSGETTMTGCLIEEGKTVRALVAQLCECFYKAGWATGTGGGVSIRVGGPKENRPYRIFVAPSGVQKEDMVGDDVFELDMERNVVVPPRTPNMRQSACTPLWYVVYKHVPSAKCVIHTHSMHAQLATLLDPTEKSSVLRVTHLEMLKGVGNHSYDSILEIPIIDNRPSEDLLAEQLEEAILKYPKCNAVLVRRHGMYVWGDSWEQAKAQCESFDYLCEAAVKMKGMGLESGLVPKSGTYREEGEEECRMDAEDTGEEKKEDSASPPAKRQKVAPAFNAAGATNNDADLVCSGTIIPLVPRDSKILLLDIEGTTTSISFVKDVLFPYVLANFDKYLNGMESQDLVQLQDALDADLVALGASHPSNVQVAKTKSTLNTAKGFITCYVRALMAHDVKATGLKSLQGKMWKAGYASGELVGHLYSDFTPMLQWCKSNDVKVCIYSSGSIAAQKLLFGHTSEGDITSYFGGHFDTTSGSKRESASYGTIAKALGVSPKDVIFVTDLEAEIHAAKEAGMTAVMAVRPGNAPLSADTKNEFPVIRSLLQLCGAD